MLNLFEESKRSRLVLVHFKTDAGSRENYDGHKQYESSTICTLFSFLSGGSVTRLLAWQNATKMNSDVISAFCDKENSEKGG
jgi:hypothetical protein